MEEIRMSRKERERLELLARVRDEELTLVEVAALLPLSYRQCKRVWKRYQLAGDAGLVHRLRGQPSNRGQPAALRQRALTLCAELYPDFGATLAAERLAKDHDLHLDHETLRRWRRAAGHAQPQRRRDRHRQRRERKAHVGELIQIDGSHHDWFEGRGPRGVLMVLIDDATNQTYARFYETEDTRAAFDVFRRYCDRYGLPRALYADLDSIYRVNPTRSGGRSLTAHDTPAPPLTQFGRAMQALGVRIVPAYSPQAKGRVERRHGVFQDRLVKELRLAGLADCAAANRYLDETFLPDLNARFTVVAASATDLHRKLPRGVCLSEVLCWEQTRVVARDWTLSWDGRIYQLDRRHAALSLAGRRVSVRELLDGQRQILWRGQKLQWRELPAPPAASNSAVVVPANQAKLPAKAPVPRARTKPAANHPWRRWGIAVGRNFRRGGARAGGGALPPTPPPARANGNGKKPRPATRGHFYRVKPGDISKEF